MPFKTIHDRLFVEHGLQHWWPADTPFEVMVGAILTQNTAWSNVEKAICNLKTRDALSPETMLGVPHTELAEWIRPSGYFNVKAERLRNYCRWYLEAGGLEALERLETAELRQRVLSVNGVGPETADDIVLYAFGRPVFVIDTYTRRLFSRLEVIQGDETYEELRSLVEQGLASEPNRVELFNEYHALIVAHAKDYCRKKSRCAGCCLRSQCPGRDRV
ncbi:endonuclease III domain-containing protein [Thiohalomonas denitrificans]|uniref:endonuclease III domain-containing protein n=1 Tax=Thiohalomonas denitrificans TaxID=415747 RepID=UPI0026F2E90D|nr:endonuclease III domain-containing protein [Thiohalomonas denitrificans]